MISSLESFSTELLFEIFEYLSPYDLFRSFINLNDLFNTIIHLYPLHLNLESISRLEFDYICLHLQPKQVISLILSDENIPHQVELFKKYFPLFKQQFIHLQSLTLIEMLDENIDLPKSVKSLKIRKYDIYKNFSSNFDQLLEQQAKVLTHLKIDRIGVEKTLVYTIPRFRPKHFIYPLSNFPYHTRAPTNIEQKMFYQNKIESSDNFLLSPIHRFIQVKFLILSGLQLMSLDILQTIIDFNQIEELDVSYIKYLSRHERVKLIKYFPRLHSLAMEYHPLFVVPSQIHTLRLEN